MSAAATIAPASTRLDDRQRIRKRREADPERERGSANGNSRNGKSQCMRALAKANEVRLARARLKREIEAGRHSVIDVVRDCPWEAESMTVSELLCSQRRWGRARSRKLLVSINLGEAKRLATLTPRQTGLLIRALMEKGTA